MYFPFPPNITSVNSVTKNKVKHLSELVKQESSVCENSELYPFCTLARTSIFSRYSISQFQKVHSIIKNILETNAAFKTERFRQHKVNHCEASSQRHLACLQSCATAGSVQPQDICITQKEALGQSAVCPFPPAPGPWPPPIRLLTCLLCIVHINRI